MDPVWGDIDDFGSSMVSYLTASSLPNRVSRADMKVYSIAPLAVHASGFFHFKPGKREKSESVEASSQPCSTASAAKRASVTRLATALLAMSNYRNMTQ